LRLLSKDHAVTVAVCDDTLTGIRYTTLKDATLFYVTVRSSPIRFAPTVRGFLGISSSAALRCSTVSPLTMLSLKRFSLPDRQKISSRYPLIDTV
jgi:hypothetical protein